MDQKNKVEDLFDTSKPIWERIKTVEDAIEYTGMTLPDCIGELPVDVQAYLKLRIVVAAYNELTADTLKEFPKFERGEWRYFPYYVIYWRDRLEEMSEEEKSRIVLRSCNNSSSAVGVGCCGHCGSVSTHTNAIDGSRLAFKYGEAARECAERFADLWLDYCMRPKKER